MQDTPFVLAFTAGELSPWLSTRFDLQAYQRGAALLSNFMVQPYGGLRRRCGTTYVGEAAAQQAGAVRLVPFCFSESDALMLELYPGGMRVYRNGEPVRDADGAVYTMAAPWDSADELRELRCTQVNDVIYITSVYRAPLVLSRYADNDWQCDEFKPEPFPRETYRNQPYALRVKMQSDGTGATLVLNGGLLRFSPDMVNAEYVIAEAEIPSRTLFLNKSVSFTTKELPDLSKNNVIGGVIYTEYDSVSKMYRFYTVKSPYLSSYYNGNLSAAGYPDCFLPGALLLDDGKPYEVSGDWEIRTHGEWNAVWELWRSYDTRSDNLDFNQWQWTCIRTLEQNSYSERKNYIISGTEETPCRMVLVCRSAASSSPGAHIYMNILGGQREYKFRVTGYTSPYEATARLLTKYLDGCPAFVTRRWSFGAYGARNGYPAFSALHQGRLWLGGSVGLPTTLVASVADDFANFDVSSADDSALHLTLSTTNQSRICWVCGMRSLLVGTTESEWTLSTPDGSALTPSNATFSRQASVGSEPSEAEGVENTVFYVQRGGKRLREFSYKLEADGYTSSDTSLLAEHLFAAGVKEWAVQRGSSARLWVLMQDSSLAVLTTNTEQQVTAWQRVSMQGRTVLHLAALPRRDSTEDELWLVVRNDCNGLISLERFHAATLFADGATAGVLPENRRVHVPHLAGCEVLVYPAAAPQQAVRVQVAADGVASVPELPVGTPYGIGAVYRSELCTMPLENERTYNTVRQQGRVRVRLLESDPAFYYKATHADRWEQYAPARQGRAYSYTGEVRVSQIPAPSVGQGFALYADSALDFRLVSLTVELDYHWR